MNPTTKTRRGTKAYRAAWATVFSLVVLGTGCSDGESPTALEPEADQLLEALLHRALQDEYHAEAVYLRVMEDFGPVSPFSNIVGAEVRHSEAIVRLYANRGWAVPANEWSVSSVEGFASVSAACAVGVEAEIANAAVYDELLESEGLPTDVTQVFTSNRAASLDKHLPAFQRCS